MTFPVDLVIPQLTEALATHACCVLVAEPGAGKTTRVPLALRDAPWLGGKKIVMLEPRRLAARASASMTSISTSRADTGFRSLRQTLPSPQRWYPRLPVLPFLPIARPSQPCRVAESGRRADPASSRPVYIWRNRCR